MKRLRSVGFLLILLAWSAQGQTSSRPYEVGSLQFDGNDVLGDGMLQSVIRTEESPWGIWKFIYANISEKLGKAPVFFDPITFAGDYHALQRLYEDQGFFRARIDTSIVADDAARTVDLTFRIVEGPRSVVDTLIVNGLQGLPSDVVDEIHGSALIQKGDPFVFTTAEAELRRIVQVFANSGYVRAKVDTVSARRYASTNNVSLMYALTPGQRYQFGGVTVQEDTTSPNHVDSAVVLRHLDFREGDFYSEQKKIESERNLNRLGVFETSKIENVSVPTNADSIRVPVSVMVRTRSFQELTPEIGVNDENNAFNILTGVGYTHRNFFGGARNFNTHVRLSLQSIQGVRFKNIFSQTGLRDSALVSKIDISVQLIQPYFFNNKTILTATLSGILDKQPSYYLPILRSRIGIAAQTATYTRAFLDWSLELMDPRTVSTQSDTVVGTEFEKQFNSILAFTIQRDKRNDLFLPSSGFFHSASIEEAGIFPRTFGPLVGTKLPYSQYVKFTALGQWYWDPSQKRSWIWALRLRAGSAFLYGHPPLQTIPLTQRFYGGGSSSVRGWRARDLGMLARPDLGGKTLFEANFEGRWNALQGAGMLGFLDLEKISFVFFADAGNVWSDAKYVRLPDIALAAGFGFRYNTVAGPVRIDFGMKMYDPREGAGRQWVTQKRFFGETFSQGVIHLGVGHAF